MPGGSGSSAASASTSPRTGRGSRASAHVRYGVPEGTAFLADGIAEASANAFTEPIVEVHKR